MTTQEMIDEITTFLDTEPDYKVKAVYDAFLEALSKMN